MGYKLVNKTTIGGNIFDPVKNSGQRVELAKVTSEYYSGETVSELDVSETAFDMYSGDKINIVGQLLTLDAAAGAEATLLSVAETVLTFDIELNDTIEIDNQNLFVQYQRKTEGTIAGMPVDADDLGPINYTHGVYSIIGVDPNYVKILPKDFLINADGSYEALEMKDAANTGLQVGDAAQEMVATVNIPYGTTATHVTVWGTPTTKAVNVFEMDVDANGKSGSLGTGTTNGSAISITSTAATTTNYLLIKVSVTATSNRVFGGTVTLTQN